MSEAAWVNLDAQSEEIDDYRTTAVEAVETMYRMSSTDLSVLTPYIRIWATDESGNRIDPPLTNELVNAPKFGESVFNRVFGDRPPASIESVSMKSVNPFGFNLYKQADINIVVHRPDAVFSRSPDEDSTAVRLLLDFRNDIIIEYGWNGPATNPMVVGVNTEGANLARVRDIVRMKVTHYGFNITQDGQAKFQVFAIQNGELATRHTSILGSSMLKGAPTTDIEVQKELAERISAKLTENLTEATTKVTQRDSGSEKKVTDSKVMTITYKQLFDILFAEQLNDLGKKIGASVKLQFGLFNSKCPDASLTYPESRLRDQAIGNFRIDVKYVQEILGEKVANGKNLSVQSLIETFLSRLNLQSSWSGDYHSLDYVYPQVMLRTVHDVQKGVLLYQVIDRKRYLQTTKLVSGINQNNVHQKKDEIYKRGLHEFLKANKMPLLDLYNQQSIVRASKFSVVNDERMSDIFIHRGLTLHRGIITSADGQVTSGTRKPSPLALLYRTAINGEVTLLGNFCFDITGLMWVQFGIWAYDGPFFVVQRVDRITQSEFTTTLTLQAEGSDPLGLGNVFGASEPPTIEQVGWAIDGREDA